jgi:hypothetical protein
MNFALISQFLSKIKECFLNSVAKEPNELISIKPFRGLSKNNIPKLCSAGFKTLLFFFLSIFKNIGFNDKFKKSSNSVVFITLISKALVILKIDFKKYYFHKSSNSSIFILVPFPSFTSLAASKISFTNSGLYGLSSFFSISKPNDLAND